MFVLRNALKNIPRHGRRALLYVLICCMAVVTLQVYMASVDRTSAQLARMGERLPIHGQLSSVDASRYDGLQIRQKSVDSLLDSPYIRDLNISVQMRAVTPDTPEELRRFPTFFLEGANRLEALTGLTGTEIEWLPGYGPDCLTGADLLCIADSSFLASQGQSLGDSLTLDCYRYVYGRYGEVLFNTLGTQTLTVVGQADLISVQGAPSAVLPLAAVQVMFENAGESFAASAADFYLKDPEQLNEFKATVKPMGLTQADYTGALSTAVSTNTGVSLLLDDSAYITGATRLRESLDLLNAFLPVIIAVLVVIGYFVAYLMVQSRAAEYAVLRLLGLGKGRSVRMYFLEMTVLTLAGSLLGLLLALVLGIVSSLSSALLVFALFLVCFLLGSLIALWRLSRINVMLALSRAD